MNQIFQRLNYHHLLYFWLVASQGSVTEAAHTLRVAQPTVSAQLKELETTLGERLFERSGRKLRLTEVGELVFHYADKIFSLGNEMLSALKSGAKDSLQALRVGINDSLPKSLAYELLAPVFRHMPHTTLICLEGTQDKLLADLAAHELDIVLSDSPFDHSVRVVAFNHYLGSSGTSFFATPMLARRARTFPKSLTSLPLLLPCTGTPQRKAIDRWFFEHGILPRVLGEFEDSALMKTFGGQGAGVFIGPTTIERTICSHYGVKVIGRAPKAQIDIFAISIERKIKHPAVTHLCGSARHDLLTASPGPNRL